MSRKKYLLRVFPPVEKAFRCSEEYTRFTSLLLRRYMFEEMNLKPGFASLLHKKWSRIKIFNLFFRLFFSSVTEGTSVIHYSPVSCLSRAQKTIPQCEKIRCLPYKHDESLTNLLWQWQSEIMAHLDDLNDLHKHPPCMGYCILEMVCLWSLKKRTGEADFVWSTSLCFITGLLFTLRIM